MCAATLAPCIAMKACGKCGQNKPFTGEFFQHCNRNKSGLRNFCKDCHAKRKRDLRAKQKIEKEEFGAVDSNPVMPLPEEYINNWTPKMVAIERDVKEMTWTPVSLLCLSRNKSCEGCPILDGLETVCAENCKVGQCVQLLIDSGKPLRKNTYTEYRRQF